MDAHSWTLVRSANIQNPLRLKTAAVLPSLTLLVYIILLYDFLLNLIFILDFHSSHAQLTLES